MEFAIIPKETVLLNPLKEMQPRSVASEIRLDPLTGRSSRICHFMKLQWEKPDLKDLAEKTAAHCPFCPERVMAITPCFPPEILPAGRLIDGDRILFPNLAPYDTISAVAVLGAAHFIPMTRLEPGFIAAGFELCLSFFRALEAFRHPESVYHLVNWNYMPPSGSSIVHPHLQVFASGFAPQLMREELAAARTYREVNGTNYWEDLVARERSDGSRYLGRIGRTDWLSAFAPTGVAGEVVAVVEGVHTTLELTSQDLSDLALGLTRAMAAYDEMGIYSFNMNFFSGAAGDDQYRLHLVFSPRTFFNQALGTPDVGALQHLYREGVCMAFPEEIAQRLRPRFDSTRG
jgi:UDPglucose--hexose-1-phosphate uridylyltransferase